MLTIALSTLLPTQRKYVAAVTAPVCTKVRKCFEPVRYLVVESFFVRICFCVGFADALGDDLMIAFLMACVLAIRTLHASRVLEEISAQGASHDIVELLLNELVSILLVHFFLSLANGTLAIETDVKWSSIFGLFHWDLLAATGKLISVKLTKSHGQLYAANRFEREPGVDIDWTHLWIRCVVEWSASGGSRRCREVLTRRRIELKT